MTRVSALPVLRPGESFVLAVQQRAFWVGRPGVHWSPRFRVRFDVLEELEVLVGPAVEPCYQLGVEVGEARGERAWVEVLLRRGDLQPLGAWRHAGGRSRELGDDFVMEVLRHRPARLAPDLAQGRVQLVVGGGRHIEAAAYRTRGGRQLWSVAPEHAPWFLRHEGPTWRAELVAASRWS